MLISRRMSIIAYMKFVFILPCLMPTPIRRQGSVTFWEGIASHRWLSLPLGTRVEEICFKYSSENQERHFLFFFFFYFVFMASPLCSQVANMFLFLSQSKNTAKGIIISIFTKWQSAKDCFISRSHFIKYSERETLRGVSSWVSG